jgi:hypothetical protein
MTWEEIDSEFDTLKNVTMPDFIDGLTKKYFGVFSIDVSKIPNDMTTLQYLRLFQQTGILFYNAN